MHVLLLHPLIALAFLAADDRNLFADFAASQVWAMHSQGFQAIVLEGF